MPLSPWVALPLACLLLAAFAGPPAGGAASPTAPIRLADGWRFAFGPHDGAERRDYDDSGWLRVALPHTWNAADALTKRPTFREGEGWYRRTVALDPAARPRSLALRFEGANQVTDVWWNGVHVGHHEGGYTAFTCELREVGPVRADNVLAVRVNNAVGPVPPLIADYDFYGGLYRDVWLFAADSVHFSWSDHGAPGAWAEARDVSEASATVVLHGRVTNATERATPVEIVARLLDPDGHEVTTARATLEAPARAETAFELPATAIRAPQLWSPDSPTLHSVHLELRARGTLADSTTIPLGLRTFAVDANRGLTLNGRPLRLRGTNRHQDRSGRGSAVPDSLQREDVRRIKADGFNFVRLAHYPQSDAVLDECDRVGLVVWEEIPVVNRVDTGAAFETNARAMLVEMIRQHRGHPSVCFWGLANEVLLLKPDPMPVGYVAHAARLVRGLRDLSRAEDPSRLTALAVSFDELDDGSGIQDLPDVLGLNLYFGWYYRSFGELGPWLDRFHAAHPGRPIVLSEYGADSDERVHARSPRALDFSIEYQQQFHEQTLPQLEARPWLVGTAVWNQFDFGSRRRDDTKPNLNQKGLYFFDRRPKDVAWYYRARFSREPVLHVATRDWPHRAGSAPADAVHSVVVYSNLDTVELSQGGAPLGRRPILNGAARWEVTLQPGANTLVARGTLADRTFEDLCRLVYEDRSSACSARAPARFTLAMTASACAYLDGADVAWEPAREYARGSWGFVGGTPAATHHRIFDTADDAAFQSTLEGVRAVRFDVPDGDYDLELRFAETRDHAPGERVFDVTANGVAVATALDLAATSGAFTAVSRTKQVTATGGAGVRLELTASRGETTLSAVRLTRR